MITYTLTVKGTLSETCKVVSEKVRHWGDISSGTITWAHTGGTIGAEECIFRIDASEAFLADKLNRWFNEGGRDKPFPAGTLLFWSGNDGSGNN